MSTIGNSGYGVIAFGNSASSGSSHLPNYPSTSIGHVITLEGYSDNGKYVDVVDPAGGATCLGSSFSSVQKKYTIDADKFTAFVATRGIFY